MAADVIRKINASNPIRNGSAVVAADKCGNIHRLEPPRPSNDDNTDEIYTVYRNRFDNQTYYV